MFATSTTSVAEAGDDQTITLPVSTVTLDGTNSIPTITSYAWTFISGPNTPVITSPSAPVTSVTGLTAGTYLFELSVNGGASTSRVTIQVNPAPSAIANAGVSQTIPLPSSSTTLDGSGSMGASSYAWTMVYGPNSPTIVSPASATTSVTGLAEGSYLFRLSINGGVSVSDVKVDVVTLESDTSVFASQTPVANAGNDGVSIELGMKFRSDRSGYITGLRFYKTAGNTGTHIGELYTASGTRLAQATFTSETDSGWQTVTLSNPVPINANTTYVASYFSAAGNYIYTHDFFGTASTNGPLTALADGTDGYNGVYIYTASPALPTSFYLQSNYWVDALFASSNSPVASAGPDQNISLIVPGGNDGVRGTNADWQSSDPVWLSGSQISLDSADPGGPNQCGSCAQVPAGPFLCPDPSYGLPVMTPTAPTPCEDTTSYAARMATNVYSIYSDSVKGSFDSAYIGRCLQAASQERLTMLDSVSEYHYTLYYYDQAGNLVKTVPPAGVQRIYRQSWLDSVRAARTNGTALTPAHTMASNYRYNTLNQVVAQQTPDAGVSGFWYDRLGRLVLSQNAKQLAEGGNYSYTLYDAIGRITEVGQVNSGVGSVTTGTTKVPANWEAWLSNNSTNRYQITNTVYDVQGPSGILLHLEQNPSTLRNRVSYTTITPGQTGSSLVYGTYYDYDIEGNVRSLLQDYGSTSPMGTNGQQYKRVDYDYDLISGKVNSVSYQRSQPDAFMHFYKYDAENRLTDVYTTADSVTIEHEAHYDYYKHGPLARALIGQNQVQGLDYAYTLQGWLKAVNGSILDSTKDMGHDGDPATPERQYIGRDAYGFSLHYYEGDYYPINGTAFLTSLKAKLSTAYKGLYNGNISSMAVNVGILNAPKLYNYQYDQLNRLTGMDVLNGTNTGLNLWTGGLSSTNDYRERVSYDGNGNILTYTRNGYGGTQSMDNLTYHYNAETNQLNYIHDAVPSGNYPNDLNSQNEDNYTYDAAGNLIKDDSAGITTPMTWSVYGKLLTIPSKSISYQYDAAGNRIGKTVGSTNTWYVRDAQGNILAVYNGSGMTLQEQDLYGSSRLGMISTPNVLSNTAQYLDHLGSGTLFSFTRGKKLFELTNHLGNVLVTVSDKKFGTPVTGIPSQISFYTADVKSAQDYYPFGMEMPGRSYNANYPYSFNGKRDDKDAEYGWQDYGMREYDRMRGQFISVDPLTQKYPGFSPYPFAMNSPISGIDLDGLEFYYSADGKFLGARTVDANGNKLDAKTANSVRLAAGTADVFDAKANETYTTFYGVQDLNISHKDFQKAANILRQENLSGDKQELLNFAHTAVNAANAVKRGVADLLSTTYSSVPAGRKTVLPDENTSNSANFARAGLIDALSGGFDPTHGAIRWDGIDFIAWGLNGPYGPQEKLRKEGVTIDYNLYSSLLKSATDHYGNSVRYGNNEYSIPSAVFTNSKFWNYTVIGTGQPENAGFFYNNFNYALQSRGISTFSFPALKGPNKGQIKLKATAVAGQSIFWAPNK